MKLKNISPKEKSFPFNILSVDFWCEYPKRDFEYVRWYPCHIKKLSEKQVWSQDRKSDEDMAFYTNIPFCNNKCHSCFYSKYNTYSELSEQYLKALKLEISNYARRKRISEGQFCAGYFGGGTPTAFSNKQLDDLLTHFFSTMNVKENANITMETTPNEMTKEKAELIISKGIQRVSIGVQSFDDVLLRRIGRTHTGLKAKETVKILKQAGCKIVNVDLMYGLPGESLADWEKTVEHLLDAQVDSVSLYLFIVVPFSRLFKNIMSGETPKCPTMEEADEYYDYAVNKLLTSGFKAVTKADFVNVKINPHFSDPSIESFPINDKGFEAIVAATSSYLEYPTQIWYHVAEQIPIGSGSYGNVNDYTCLNDPNLEQYITKVNKGELPIVMGTEVPLEEKRAAAMVMGTKCLKVRRKDFYNKFKMDMTELYGKQIKQLEEWELVKLTDDALEVLYPKGWYYSDNISKMFYSKNNYKIPQPAVDNINALKFFKS